MNKVIKLEYDEASEYVRSLPGLTLESFLFHFDGRLPDDELIALYNVIVQDIEDGDYNE